MLIPISSGFSTEIVVNNSSGEEKRRTAAAAAPKEQLHGFPFRMFGSTGNWAVKRVKYQIPNRLTEDETIGRSLTQSINKFSSISWNAVFLLELRSLAA